MKKLLAALLCAILILTAFPVSASYEDMVTEVMCVVNCKEWVSLREKPDTSSKRLKKVHLGELVSDCIEAKDGFIYCEFDGKYGYIKSDYLYPTEFTLSDGILKNQMVVKCEEWVSLRKEPNTSSERLKKVPLGAIVTRCVTWNGNYVYCEYKGARGYIQTKYLKDADYTATPTPTVKPTVTPTATPVMTYPSINGSMVVVNCLEWVSLRAMPSSNSAQLKQVPLNAVVENCVQVNDKYIFCSYEGAYGYININYLEEYTGLSPEGFADLPDLPAFDELLAAGENVLAWSDGKHLVLAQRAYAEDHEELLAVCYSPELKPLWAYACQSEGIAQLTGTNAMMGGTAEDPQLITYVTGRGLVAISVNEPAASVAWEITEGDVTAMSGSTVSAVDTNGNLYLCGSFDDAPMCIDAEGSILWEAENEDPDIYWPYRINIRENTIEVFYDSYHETEELLCYVITYSKINGSRISVETRTYEFEEGEEALG